MQDKKLRNLCKIRCLFSKVVTLAIHFFPIPSFFLLFINSSTKHILTTPGYIEILVEICPKTFAVIMS